DHVVVELGALDLDRDDLPGDQHADQEQDCPEDTAHVAGPSLAGSTPHKNSSHEIAASLPHDAEGAVPAGAAEELERHAGDLLDLAPQAGPFVERLPFGLERPVDHEGAALDV